jgi:hypothetical protein
MGGILGPTYSLIEGGYMRICGSSPPSCSREDAKQRKDAKTPITNARSRIQPASVLLNFYGTTALSQGRHSDVTPRVVN